MKERLSSKLHSFYIYQRERFPVGVLLLSLIAPLLGFLSVTARVFDVFEFLSVLVVSLLYLLHIRILDDERDFTHDSVYHTDRPVQRGVISLRDLTLIDFFVVVSILALSFVLGPLPFIFSLLMLGYSFLARNEFFLAGRIRRHFFLYNAVNLGQLFLMQFFVYSVFLQPFVFDRLIGVHFLFICTGTVIFEFLRKFKLPGRDGEGKDTYTFYLPFETAVRAAVLLVFVNAALFFAVASFHEKSFEYLLFALAGFVVVAATAALHLEKRSRTTNGAMQLTIFLVYNAFNLIIYFIPFS